MLTVEELMRPRYKVIADFPGCSYEVGTVLYVDPSSELYSPIAGYSHTLTRVMQWDVEKYPHLFQLLPWWSEREQRDLPEYLVYQKDRHYPKGTVVKVDQWNWEWRGKSWWFRDSSQPPVNLCTRYIDDYLPATIADYEAYNQQKEGKSE